MYTLHINEHDSEFLKPQDQGSPTLLMQKWIKKKGQTFVHKNSKLWLST